MIAGSRKPEAGSRKPEACPAPASRGRARPLTAPPAPRRAAARHLRRSLRPTLAAALLALPLLAVLAPSAQAQTTTLSAGAVEGSDVNQESEVATPAALFVTVTPLAASVSLRNCFTSSLSTPASWWTGDAPT